MMSMLKKKKHFKFHVNFGLEELSSVPFLSGIIFVKIRLKDGSFSKSSDRKEISNNCVCWRSKFNFPCKMTANYSTGELDPSICRISVRMEKSGGKDYRKLGFVDVDLAEYAGSGQQRQKFLLEGYDKTRSRQDNSVLEASIELSLISGDPVFKVPQKSKSVFYRIPGEMETDEFEPSDSSKVLSEDNKEEGSLASNSSGFGSLPRKERPTILPAESPDHHGNFDLDPGEKSHSRNNSYASQHSKGSGYNSLSHSRQSSIGNDFNTHTRSPSAGSSLINDLIRNDRRKKLEDSTKERRMGPSRVDPDDVVNELLSSTDLLTPTEENNAGGLQLLVDKDGTCALR